MAISYTSLSPSGVTQRAQVFTSNGTLVVPSNVVAIQMEVAGGGGGGGGAIASNPSTGGGGGGGAYYNRLYSVTAGETLTVTIGGGGAGGTTSGTVGTTVSEE